MKTNYFFWMVLLVFFTSLTAKAQQVGYVDVNYVLEKMPEYKTVQDEMKVYEDKAGAELKSKETEFEKKVKELEAMAQTPNPNQALIQARYQELQEMEKQVQELQSSLQTEYSSELSKRLKPLEEKLKKAVDDVAAEKGGIYILRREASIFEVPENDLSDAVLKKMGITVTDATAGKGNLKSSNKMGYFDSNKVIPQMTNYKQAQSQVETYTKKLQENLDAQRTIIQQKMQQLEQLEKGGTASEDAKKKLRTELQTLQTEFQKSAQDAQTKAQQKSSDLLNPILDEVQKTIEQTAKDNGFTYILKMETLLYEPAGNNLGKPVGAKLGVTDEEAVFSPITDAKIGYFDLQYVLAQMPEYKKAEEEMKTYSKQIEDEMKARQEEFQRKLEEYQKKMEAGDYTPAMQASKEKELQSLEQQFQRFQQTIQQDAQNQEAKLIAPIYEKIQNNINEVAKEAGYQFIIRAEACYTTVKADNISDRVLRKMGIVPKN